MMLLMCVVVMMDGVALHVLFQNVTIHCKTKSPQCVVAMVSVMHQRCVDAIQGGQEPIVPCPFVLE